MTAKAPVDKLPLAVRKNVRDEYENKRGETEEKISKLLGETWKIEANPNLIYAYAEDDSYGQRSLGACMSAYFDGAIYRLNYFLDSQKHGSEGAAELNKLAHKHVMSLEPDVEKKNTYCGVDIHDGVLRILFTEGNLGTNVDNALEGIEKAINEASKTAADPQPLSYTARNGIKQEWSSKIDEIQKKLIKQTHNDELKLVPNFEANAAKLAAGKDVRDDWESVLGDFTRRYYEGLEYQMRYQKFEEDDLLYEGFNEAVSKGQVEFRVVDKLQGSSSYNEVIVEDGVLAIQTTPNNFGTNVDYACEKIVDIL